MRVLRARVRAAVADERGSSPVEFVLVGVLLTALTFGVLQFGFAVYVRNVVHDAAVDGAFHGALADASPSEGAARARQVITRTVGAEYATDVTAHPTDALGSPAVQVTVRTTLPLLGLFGAPRALEVSARAPLESFD
jgi:Flp pilus assembly protein TadG